jgi:hypothetical protein
MRLALVAILVAATAQAAPPKVKAIDVAPVVEKLAVYKDDVGNYYVSPKSRAFESSDDAEKWVFFGDGKSMYQQRVIGSSQNDKGLEWNLWSPRAREMVAATLSLLTTESRLDCRGRLKDDGMGRRKLTQLNSDEAATLFKSAKFYPPLHTRSAHFLARDDDAHYYYVDAIRDDLGGNGYRVFMGMKGAMKQLPMSNMASDSVGEIFATKSGQLKIVAGKNGTAYWVKNGRKTELTIVPVLDNRYLVYRELGIYGALGVVCDDQ